MNENKLPLVTFALFAYNQEKYIEEAVNSAFKQEYKNLEIIITDDCSQDGTLAIIQEMVSQYHGDHKVVVVPNSTNSGLATSISNACEMAKGELIVAAAGDDISTPDRVDKLVEAWVVNSKESCSIYSHFSLMSENGDVDLLKLKDPYKRNTVKDKHLDALNNFSGLSGCAQAWTKDIFSTFGKLNKNINHEDVIIPLRALLMGGAITFIPENLVYYRYTPGSITRQTFASGKERIQKMAKYWYGRVSVFDQFEIDKQNPLVREKISESDFVWLQGAVQNGALYAKRMHSFYSGGFFGKISVILKLTGTIKISQVLKLMIIAIFPFAYGLSK
jgi:glycosyltransferase involved in cell wall biosynthesis